jgi:hypothetical protein
MKLNFSSIGIFSGPEKIKQLQENIAASTGLKNHNLSAADRRKILKTAAKKKKGKWSEPTGRFNNSTGVIPGRSMCSMEQEGLEQKRMVNTD